MQYVALPGPGADVFPLALQRQWDLFSIAAHPADMAGGHADHQGIGQNIGVDHGARADKRIFSDGDTANDGAVGAEGRAFFDICGAVLVLARNPRARIVNVGKDHARPAEHAFVQRHTVIDADIILNLAAIADDDPVADKDILAQRCLPPNPGAAADMRPVPDTAAGADPGAGIDHRGCMRLIMHGSIVERQGNRPAIAGGQVCGDE